MAMIVLRLNPDRMENPLAEIRYVLPDLLVERGQGVLKDEGYDYFRDSYLMLLFLSTNDEESALAIVLNVIENERFMENDLRPAAVVAVERADGYEVVYPKNFTESFEIE